MVPTFLVGVGGMVAVLVPNLVRCHLKEIQRHKKYRTNILSQVLLFKLATRPIVRTVFSVGLGGMFFFFYFFFIFLFYFPFIVLNDLLPFSLIQPTP